MARTPKTIQQARQNLEASIPLIPGRYVAGVQNADWKTAAESDQAETLYAQGVQRAIQNRSRQAGIRRISNEQWRERAMTLGAQNIAAGLQAGLDNYERNFTPVYNRIIAAQRNLPPKTLDANQNIDRRLKPIVAAAQGRTT